MVKVSATHESPTRSSLRTFGKPCRGILAIVFGLLTLAYVLHPHGRFTVGGRAHGDGIYNYVYLRSLVLDGDIDFTNDYNLLGNPHNQPKGPRGLPQNRFTVGSAILWAPSFVIGHIAERISSIVRDNPEPADGTSLFVQRTALFGSVLWGFAAIVLSIKLAMKWVEPQAACWAGVALAAATPLPWYMVMQPSWSHACSAFVVAAFISLWYRDREERSLLGWAALGALAGLMMLVRPQDVLFLCLPMWDFARQALAVLRGRLLRPMRRVVLEAAIFVIVTTIVFTPQMLIWRMLYGSLLVVPQGSDFLLWGNSKWVEVLTSSRNGLFSWTPAVYIGVIGLVMMSWRRQGEARAAALALLLAFLAQAYVNGATHDWWGGWAFGGRRLLDCTIAYGLGLAYMIHGLRRVVITHQRWILASIPALAILSFSLCNMSYMADYFHAELERDASQPMAPASQRFGARIIESVYKFVGHPGAIPANWIFGWKSGAGPDRYDLVSGLELGPRRGRPTHWDKLVMGDERWSMEGFGEISILQGESASWVDGDTATIALPMREPASHELSLRLRPATPGARLRVSVGSTVVFDSVLDEGWHTYSGYLPAEALRPGMNYAYAEQVLPSPPRFVDIGTTGWRSPLEVEVRSHIPQTEDPLSFWFGSSRIRIMGHGVTLFAILGEPAQPQHMGTFDTAYDPHASRRFARAVRALPEGTPVALGLAGPATARWSRVADKALRDLGASQRLSDAAYGTSYALVGAKGAPPGTAVELTRKRTMAAVRIGRPQAERHEGIAWGWIVLSNPGSELPQELRAEPGQ